MEAINTDDFRLSLKVNSKDNFENIYFTLFIKEIVNNGGNNKRVHLWIKIDKNTKCTDLQYYIGSPFFWNFNVASKNLKDNLEHFYDNFTLDGKSLKDLQVNKRYKIKFNDNLIKIVTELKKFERYLYIKKRLKGEI